MSWLNKNSQHDALLESIDSVLNETKSSDAMRDILKTDFDGRTLGQLSPDEKGNLFRKIDKKVISKIEEGGMPSSVIKAKQKLANMSHSEFAEKHKDKSDADLQAMAWRHGYGKGSNFYVDKKNKGSKTEQNEDVRLDEIAMADTEYSRAHNSAKDLTNKAHASMKLDHIVDAIKAHKKALSYAKSDTNKAAHTGHIRDLSKKIAMSEDVRLDEEGPSDTELKSIERQQKKEKKEKEKRTKALALKLAFMNAKKMDNWDKAKEYHQQHKKLTGKGLSETTVNESSASATITVTDQGEQTPKGKEQLKTFLQMTQGGDTSGKASLASVSTSSSTSSKKKL